MNQSAIKVLNHGSIRLVDHMGSDLSVVRAARTSYDAEWRAGEDEGKDAKLLNYLVKHKHTSPLECVTFTFDVHLPIFVARQWMRHRMQSYSEISARYAVLPEQFYIPEVSQITGQSKANKQQRTDQEHPEAAFIQAVISKSCSDAFSAYQALIDMGAPRELARGVLPVNTFTHMFTTVNLLNLLKFIGLRDHAHAQHEIRVYAVAMLELIEPIVPHCVAAFREHGL